jgi:hypoxanthine-guanine phosphoribosyltransferase
MEKNNIDKLNADETKYTNDRKEVCIEDILDEWYHIFLNRIEQGLKEKQNESWIAGKLLNLQKRGIQIDMKAEEILKKFQYGYEEESK